MDIVLFYSSGAYPYSMLECHTGCHGIQCKIINICTYCKNHFRNFITFRSFDRYLRKIIVNFLIFCVDIKLQGIFTISVQIFLNFLSFNRSVQVKNPYQLEYNQAMNKQTIFICSGTNLSNIN